MTNVNNLSNQLQSYDNVYIYGAGYVGKFVLEYLTQIGLADKINSFVVTENKMNRGGV